MQRTSKTKLLIALSFAMLHDTVNHGHKCDFCSINLILFAVI